MNAQRRTERPVITPRLSFFVKDDESIDFERTTDETIDKLARAVQRPEARARLGLDAANAAAAAGAASWAQTTPYLVDTLNMLAATFAANTWKLTDEQTSILILRRDPRTHTAITELSADVLAQYFPEGLGRHDKLVSLGVLLAGFIGDSIQKIRATMPASSPSLVTFPRETAQS